MNQKELRKTRNVTYYYLNLSHKLLINNC